MATKSAYQESANVACCLSTALLRDDLILSQELTLQEHKKKKIESVKPAILVRPSGKHVRIATLPSCLGSWDTETIPLIGHQPLF